MFNKDDFVKAVKELKIFNDAMEPYDKILKDDGPWCRLYDNCVKLLAHTVAEKFNAEENYENIYCDIEYFLYEVNYGEDFEIGMVEDPDGTQPDFSTAEKLYEYFEETYKQ